jgi:hypothetical protein
MSRPSAERISALLASLALSACASYSAKPISATVINADTGQPLEGVNVVVTWELEYVKMEFGYSESRGAGLMTQMEAVTGSDGRFRIPGWGPAPVPSDLPARSMLSPMQPSIRLFKSGYRTHAVGNQWDGSYLSNPFYKGPAQRASDFDGKTIALTPLPEKINDFDWWILVNPSLSKLMVWDCSWETIPKYLRSLIKERERIVKQSPRANVSHLPRIDDVERWPGAERCDSNAKAFLATP